MGNRLQLNSNKTRWFWVIWPLGLGDFPSLVLDRVALFQVGPMHNLERWQVWLLHSYSMCYALILPISSLGGSVYWITAMCST